MHLKSLTLKGFKSFPDRTRLDFGPGVSVVVGPNGSGKSNVTDAVLWALGEQSPLAVRGQSMQDVIFGGARGVKAGAAAEVELVLDNSDGTVALPVSEISILRRLDRTGEGEYRLNGARCRLVDVIEVLSDTGLGKEMHSVISQGRVDAIVNSKPRDRRLLIEEAAGLGKHRRRRRRAQLKLERTQENLDRALDVEREARSRLRPLKRQAEAAELHARLERQVLEVRWELARDAARARGEELVAAEADVASARAALAEIESLRGGVVAQREQAELALAQRGERRDALARRAYAARSAHERLDLRLEQARATAAHAAEGAARGEAELGTLGEAPNVAGESPLSKPERITALEAELGDLERRRGQELLRELTELEGRGEQHRARLAEREAALSERRGARARVDEAADLARERVRAAERRVEEARREAARVGAELAAVNQFLRSHAGARGGASTLSDELEVQSGYELAVAAALDGRLGAGLAPDLDSAAALLERSGPDGGSALITAPEHPPVLATQTTRPAAGAQRLLEVMSGSASALAVVGRLLADAWVVQAIEELPVDFRGMAVTRAGRVWCTSSDAPSPASVAPWGELRQAPEGGAERVLARRNERARLIAASEVAVQAEVDARLASERLAADARAAQAARDEADRALRQADRDRAEGAEALRQTAWLIDQRRRAPQQGPLAVRRAELEGELAAERRQAERDERERLQRTRRVARLKAQVAAARALVAPAERLSDALLTAVEAVAERAEIFAGELDADRRVGEGVAAALRACAQQEAEIQSRLRVVGEAVTGAEVAAQGARDRAREAGQELAGVAERLALANEPASEPLLAEQAAALATRLERLDRRREALGPVNPLAQAEYDQALHHVEELQERRTDLESALRELRSLIRETDRQIQETFEHTFAAAARNFEELVGDVFPGGRGHLRLVREDSGPRPILGGESLEISPGRGVQMPEAAAEAEAQADAGPSEDLLGVEIDVTPAGKSSKRLSLLSGGEKSMTALAFLFAVFLAQPCPFYILDEVEAALDDLNLDRFLSLLRRHSARTQFIVITHQKRTMEAADWLYGVSMGTDGVSKVVSRRLPGGTPALEPVSDVAAGAA